MPACPTRLLAALLALACLAAPAAAQEPRLKPNRPGVTDAAVVAFGLWGPQSVFESEARGAARVLARRLDGEGRAIVRFNTKRGGSAGPATLARAIRDASAVLEPDRDVLAVVLTSHGAPEGLGVVAGRRRGMLAPAELKAMLDESPVRHRVVIVSACYSGVFAQALADERTLVITAAAPDRPSFGCRDGARWTYFGDAFFNRALRREAALDAAFARAVRLVTERERREGFDPSNPRIAGGGRVLELLAAGR
jgi:hypothetical protein